MSMECYREAGRVTVAAPISWSSATIYPLAAGRERRPYLRPVAVTKIACLALVGVCVAIACAGPAFALPGVNLRITALPRAA